MGAQLPQALTWVRPLSGLSLCSFSDPQMVREFGAPRPAPNYADEEEGPSSTALLSDFWKAAGGVFLTQQLCREG